MQDLNKKGPIVQGYGLDYTAPRGGANVDVYRAPGMGTNVNAVANANLYTSPKGNTRVDGNAMFNQHFSPRSRPDYGFGVTFRHNF